MSGVYSRTAQCGMKVMFAAMRLLKEQGGSCRLSVLRSLLGECCDFSGWELENVGGSVRWHNFLSWYSSCYVAAGFIRKQRGTWYLTEDGVACLSSSSESAAFDLATAAYKKCSGVASASPSGDILPASSSSLTLGEMKERADEGLRAAIASRSPYEFQDMVAALLHAMGYFTPFVAQREKMAVLMSWRSMILLVRPSLVLRCRLSTRLPHPCLLKSFVSWSACLIVMVMLVWWLLLACLHRRLIGQLVNPIGAFVLLMAMNS